MENELLKWKGYHEELITMFGTLFERNLLVDCTLAAEGQCLKAHQMVLAACSPYFQLLFSEAKHKHPIVILKDVKFQELKAVLHFIYNGEVSVTKPELKTFLEVASSLSIRGLENSKESQTERCPTFDVNMESVNENHNSSSVENSIGEHGSTLVEKHPHCPRVALKPNDASSSSSSQSRSSVCVPSSSDVHLINPTLLFTSQSISSKNKPSCIKHHIDVDSMNEVSAKSNKEVDQEVSRPEESVTDESENVERVIGPTEWTDNNSKNKTSITSEEKDNTVQSSHAFSTVVSNTFLKMENVIVKEEFDLEDSEIDIENDSAASQKDCTENEMQRGENALRSVAYRLQGDAEKDVFRKEIVVKGESLEATCVPVITLDSSDDDARDTWMINEEESDLSKHSDILNDSSWPSGVEMIVPDKVDLQPGDSVYLSQLKIFNSHLKNPMPAMFPEVSDTSLCGGLTGKDLSVLQKLPSFADTKQSMSCKMANRMYQCPECNYTAWKLCKLRLHFQSHVNRKPYNFLGCVKVPKNVHIERTVFTCSECDYSTTEELSLRRHQRIHVAQKPYKCLKCNYTARHRQALKGHERIHSGERPFKCSECDYSFKRYQHLKMHERAHTGEKPYRCLNCDFTTSRHESLKKHERIHTGERPYKCSQCDYAAKQFVHLKKHQRVHTGEKPYKCSQCDFTCVHAQSLRMHTYTHNEHLAKVRNLLTLPNSINST